ncbi:hypothetical protein AURDEDRAFT_154451 [Auricularia subglabra TFB-10046 SS5]|uniref:MYND-type domain-containing protein n=1 Tax=Auricularia subglabra (strain TFB-10046 / SS5) TaxID=717982 RepID=J0WU15_AURST|nr:hypothetical protein AURDEDRAFT_154451 [Auricularia subglabra TFB-10046 SS5]
MPGPGSKKAKSKGGSRAPPPPLDLSGTLGPYSAANRICAALELPELKSRSALKQIHKDFDAVQRKLSSLHAAHASDDRVLEGLVVIWGKLCVDAKLRDLLIKHDLLEKLVPLLQKPACRYLVLRALAAMSSNSGKEARSKIAARATAPVLDVMCAAKEKDDQYLVDACMSMLSHCLEGHLDHQRLEKRSCSFPWARVIDAFLDVLADPHATVSAKAHAPNFLLHATQSLRVFFLDNPRALQFIVALLHSKALDTRTAALFSLMNLHYHVASNKISREVDPHKLMRARWPEHISAAMMSYGPTRCDVYQTLNSTLDFQKAMMKAAEDCDLVQLGTTLYGLIMSHERSIARGYFQDESGAVIRTRLPFTSFEDSLPHCAEALERLGPSHTIPVGNARVSAQDMADVLRIKSHMQRGRWDRARAVARSGLERNPNELYFYYALSIGEDDTAEEQVQYSRKGLARVKEGLRLPGARGSMLPINDSYVRLNMLMNSAERSLFLASSGVWDALNGEAPWERVAALLRIAYDDSKVYIRDAPPDSLNMHRLIVVFILMSFIWDGPSFSPNLRELKPQLDRLKIAEEISRLVYTPPEPIGQRLAFETIMEHHAAACQQWGVVVEQLASDAAQFPAAAAAPHIELPEEHDELFEWLAADAHHHHHKHDETFVSRWSDFHAELYRCSSCGSASAALRKCSRCGKARYCDQACQKKDWADGHKKLCQSSEI